VRSGASAPALAKNLLDAFPVVRKSRRAAVILPDCICVQ